MREDEGGPSFGAGMRAIHATILRRVSIEVTRRDATVERNPEALDGPLDVAGAFTCMGRHVWDATVEGMIS